MPSHMTCERGADMMDVNPSQADILEVPPAVAKKAIKEKKVARRGGGFSKDEDKVVCSAFLNVSKNSIIGIDQCQGGYYKRFHAYYNAYKPEGSNRSQLAIQGRWLTIQRAVNKFCGFKAAIDRRNESGKNEQDRIEDAIKMYERAEPFHFIHCWMILRDQAKWNEKILEINNDAGKGVTSSVRNTTPLDSEGQSQQCTDERPEGRDSAKRRKRDAESSSSHAVDMLQRLHESREKSQLKEDEQLLQILNRKDEKINLQRDLLKMQMHEMDMKKEVHETKKQQHEEQLQLRKQENEIRAKQTEAQLLTAEAGIMAIDLDKVAPHLKDYYIGMQRQIMERRGFTSSAM